MTTAQASSMQQRRAIAELAFAGALWGFGFIAVAWTLKAGSPLTITGWRFLIAGSIGVILMRGILLSVEGRGSLRELARASAVPGFLICSTLIFQTWGMQYTTATKSGFITCLYVLIVPLMEPLVGGPKPTRVVFISAITAMIGVALMCGLAAGLFESVELDERSRLNWGDGLTLLCAFAASAHILAVDRANRKLGPKLNSMHFNTLQSLWAGIPALILALMIEPGAHDFIPRVLQTSMNGTDANAHYPLLGLLSLSFGSTLIAFALQVRAQKVISSSTASLLFLLESPFAAIFAFLLLGETLSITQLIGGAIVLLSVGYASYHASR